MDNTSVENQAKDLIEFTEREKEITINQLKVRQDTLISIINGSAPERIREDARKESNLIIGLIARLAY